MKKWFTLSCVCESTLYACTVHTPPHFCKRVCNVLQLTMRSDYFTLLSFSTSCQHWTGPLIQSIKKQRRQNKNNNLLKMRNNTEARVDECMCDGLKDKHKDIFTTFTKHLERKSTDTEQGQISLVRYQMEYTLKSCVCVCNWEVSALSFSFSSSIRTAKAACTAASDLLFTGGAHGGKERFPIFTWSVNLRDRDTRAERHVIFMTVCVCVCVWCVPVFITLWAKCSYKDSNTSKFRPCGDFFF